ncbi:MAG: hypothetical protein ABIK98_11660 [Pseudomonadota bacterium]
MTEKESAKFKIRMDDHPESQFQNEFQDLRVEKLSRRLTLITILIPCLVGIILFFVYRDIQTRVGQVDTGTTEVKTLSKDLETRFSSLSAKQTQLQENLSEQIASLEKTTAALQKNLKEVSAAINQVRSSRISDNKKLSDDINAINHTLATLMPIPKDLETLASSIKVVNEKFSKEQERFSLSLEGVKNNLIKIQADIIALSSAKIDNKALDLALKNQQEAYQKQLGQIRREIEYKITLLESRITGLKPADTPSSKETQVKPPKTATPAPPAPKPAPELTPAKDTVTSQPGAKEQPVKDTVTPKPPPEDKPAQGSSLPKPGTFIEQDIK